MKYIQAAGDFLSQLNNKFYFHLDIDTVISWGIIVLMYILYKVLNRYFKDDNQLDSFELLKLVGMYMLILAVIMASYVDIASIEKQPDGKNAFVVITIIVLGIVVLLSWASREKPSAQQNLYFTKVSHRNLILIALYTPIVLLMLTNGRILEQRLDSLKNLLPRSEIAFLDIPGEITQLIVGGIISNEQRQKLEEITNTHEDVSESAVVAFRDGDGLIKPLFFVVLRSGAKASDGLKEDIKSYIANKIDEKWIPEGMYTQDLQFVDQTYLSKLGAGSKQQLEVRKIINEHRLVKDSRVIGPPEKPIAYVVLKKEFQKADSDTQRDMAREIIEFVYNRIMESSRVSDYLKPRWVEFVDRDRIPRQEDGSINHNILQKKIKNWTDLFPASPPREEEEISLKSIDTNM